ncbi:uncharacterized protein MELLADRAFT_101618 [Melampsora larici-populina 98AG31]|uniref:Uncharacterized protein n=1 Tax=Melampsora larici-populina (strain 98AG31 / pathotype 3-4-7) TaxID=747676 RepID=F4R6F2_MELLP|nr:uncharacterized protein MELLADRAFT_101618 [Melampsora larici-populina 98AG31]EGG12471.1 hypothetical protein MELLADRAFT_101618 [Melampsora larici-populina 98AG31]
MPHFNLPYPDRDRERKDNNQRYGTGVVKVHTFFVTITLSLQASKLKPGWISELRIEEVGSWAEGISSEVELPFPQSQSSSLKLFDHSLENQTKPRPVRPPSFRVLPRNSKGATNNEVVVAVVRLVSWQKLLPTPLWG